MWRSVAPILGLLVLGLGCEAGSLRGTGEPPRGFVLDAGVPIPRDSGVADAAHDAGQGGGIDAGFGDAGAPPDAGEEPACPCPDLPEICVPPEVGAPVFTADRDAQIELLELLSCAETRVRAALYQVQWRCFTRALFDRLVRAPDLTVELVIDDDECPRDAEGKLTCALGDLEGDPRVTVIDDARSRYMHHKFVIADDRWVWTGSANLTEPSFCREHNDAIVLDAPALVSAYADRFALMFERREFGPQPRTEPISSGPFTVHFGPQSPLSEAPSWHQRLLSSIEGAERTAEIMVFAFTRDDVASALVHAHRRGVRVRGVVSPRYAGTSAVQTLVAAGIPIKKGPVHHKVLVVDDRLVATGSPNWSNNAWANAEDSLWIDSSTVAAAYARRLDALFGLADPL